MEEKLRDVASLRRLVREQRELEADYLERLEQTPEWNLLSSIRDDLKTLQEQLRSAEDVLREAIVANYDGETKKGDGWGIRIMRRVRYDIDVATEWARENLPGALVLDKKVFEKTAPLVNGPVEIVEEVTATISSDLSNWED
ncbi:MAG: hypothetical protein PHQ43_11580 [Dehalococcoidales bacterium]|nr:hypothetical protein [Dehalococcoidales bacterium]